VGEVRGGEQRALRRYGASLCLLAVLLDGGEQRKGSMRGGVRRVCDRALEMLRRVLVVRTGGLAVGGGALDVRLERQGCGAAAQDEQHREEDARQTRLPMCGRGDGR
jgi:hypothetical protein